MPFKHWRPVHSIAAAIVLLSLVLRVWNLPLGLHFQGDQGRDALIVSQIFTEADPVFIGPVTSVGNMYLGPFYYYFMLPFLLITYPSPVGPAIAVAILGAITTWLIFEIAHREFDFTTGSLAGFFYAINHSAIEYNRFSWNPNISPFFAILLFFALLKVLRGKDKYLLLASFCFSVLIQLHYVTLLTALPIIFVGFWRVLQILRLKVKKRLSSLKSFLLFGSLSLMLFLASLAPLMLFDYKHEFLNAKAFGAMFSKEEGFKQVDGLVATVRESHGRAMHVFFEVSIGKNRQLNSTLLAIIAFIYLAILWIEKEAKKKDSKFLPTFLLGIILVLNILGLAFYKHTVFNHYIAYLFPFSSLFFALILGKIWKLSYFGKAAVIASSLAFFAYNALHWPIYVPSWTIADVKNVAEEIQSRVENNEPYTLVLLSESKDLYGQNYRYYLSTMEKKPLSPEEFSRAEKLFVINENQPGADIANLPIYEIQTFPKREVVQEFQIPGGPSIAVLER